VIAGIDYSLTSPAICVHPGAGVTGSFCLDSCVMYYFTDKKKMSGSNGRMTGTLMDEWTSDQQRYDMIASWAVGVCKKHRVTHAFIEGYSYGSTGRVFNIAENVGVLKHQLWQNNIKIDVVPPTTVKKLATGKGNADKAKMEVAFIEQTSYNVKSILGASPSTWNPSSDIIDSYYICKYGYETQTSVSTSHRSAKPHAKSDKGG